MCEWPTPLCGRVGCRLSSGMNLVLASWRMEIGLFKANKRGTKAQRGTCRFVADSGGDQNDFLQRPAGQALKC